MAYSKKCAMWVCPCSRIIPLSQIPRRCARRKSSAYFDLQQALSFKTSHSDRFKKGDKYESLAEIWRFRRAIPGGRLPDRNCSLSRRPGLPQPDRPGQKGGPAHQKQMVIFSTNLLMYVFFGVFLIVLSLAL